MAQLPGNRIRHPNALVGTGGLPWRKSAKKVCCTAFNIGRRIVYRAEVCQLSRTVKRKDFRRAVRTQRFGQHRARIVDIGQRIPLGGTGFRRFFRKGRRIIAVNQNYRHSLLPRFGMQLQHSLVIPSCPPACITPKDEYRAGGPQQRRYRHICAVHVLQAVLPLRQHAAKRQRRRLCIRTRGRNRHE